MICITLPYFHLPGLAAVVVIKAVVVGSIVVVVGILVVVITRIVENIWNVLISGVKY